jgi:amidohydrolase
MAGTTSTRIAIFAIAAALLGARPSAAEPVAGLDSLYPSLDELYRELHRTPELSLQEEKTAARMAAELRRLGFEVSEKVGGHGVVGVLKNGRGPTVLLRTDMDGLPVKEETGLPFASKVTTKDAAGVVVPVMHACGHDVHMTSWVGAATLLSRDKARWRGTLVMMAQPAEERVLGARAMIKDGLFKRFPKPDFAVAIHDSPLYPAGSVAHRPGFALANVDTVEMTIYGKGGHGAAPHQTVDPVVIAARTVLSLQTLVSREINPIDPAVVTIGSIHGGTKSNIVPDEVKLQITVRSYKEEVQKHLLAGISRIAKAEAAAARAPKPPVVTVNEDTARATWNDPALDERLAKALERALGKGKVTEAAPQMVAEDFSEMSRAGIPAVLLWVGAAEPGALARAAKQGKTLPGLHSGTFAPDRERTTLTVAALELLGKP